MSDDLTVLGNDGIRRSFDEHYDTSIDVEQDPTGARQAIQTQHYRIEELEANLRHQTHLIEQFFALLDKVEETDDGRSFHPNQLRSCRALDTEKLDKILAELKGPTP